MSRFIEICQNCGKIFYQPLDKCCYCGSSFDLASYHRNWRKWYNSTRSNDFNFVKYSDFSKPTRELACAVIETAEIFWNDLMGIEVQTLYRIALYHE